MSKRKSNILIVDNSQLNRMTLRGFLKDQYNIIETDNGQNAIEIIKERKNIDLILLDFYISKSNNYPVFKELNKLGLIEYIPVIVISSNGGVLLPWKRFMSWEQQIISQNHLKAIS